MDKHIYEIKVVSNQTGLSPFTIRAWENRYNIVCPNRTDSNRRLYSDEDIQKLRLLNKAVKAGHSIGNLARLSIDELKELVNDSDMSESSKTEQNSFDNEILSSEIEASRNAILNLDNNLFEKILLESTVKHSQPVIINKFLIPLLQEIGKRWQDGTFRIAHEHLATQVIRNFLLNLISGYRFEEDAPLVIVGTPCGQKHELGALIGAVVIASQGWRPIYLGPDLPASEISYSSNVLKPKIVFLSILHSNDDPKIGSELEKINSLLNVGTKLVVSGKGLNTFQNLIEASGAVIVNTPDELKEVLSNL